MSVVFCLNIHAMAKNPVRIWMPKEFPWKTNTILTNDSETKERIRWEKICAEIKRNNEKKWIEKQWGKETVKSSSEQERMQYRRRPYSSWAVYEQIMSRLWAGGDTHKTGSGTSSRVDKRKSKTKQRTKRQGDEKIRWAERKKNKTFRCQ